MQPLILINFKTYQEAIGNKGIILAEKLSKVRNKDYEIAIAPSALLLKTIADKVKIKVYSQHADPISSGAHTGSISLDELKLMGVEGTLLNHSEKKIPFDELKQTVELCRKKGLKVIVCASNLAEVRKTAELKPDFLAYEPKELIGGEVSVTKARPEIILEAVKLVKELSRNTKVICGAGVHSKEDIGQALLLGTKGVLIGHSVPKAKNPERFLKEMLI